MKQKIKIDWATTIEWYQHQCGKKMREERENIWQTGEGKNPKIATRDSL